MQVSLFLGPKLLRFLFLNPKRKALPTLAQFINYFFFHCGNNWPLVQDVLGQHHARADMGTAKKKTYFGTLMMLLVFGADAFKLCIGLPQDWPVVKDQLIGD